MDIAVFRSHGSVRDKYAAARDAADAQTVVGSVAAGIAADGDAIARLERVLFNSLTAQLAGGAPFGGPGDRLVLLSGNLQENRGMRIAEQELDDRAFDGDCFGRVGPREGVVRMGVTRRQEGGREHEEPECEFCALRHYGDDTPHGRTQALTTPQRLKAHLSATNAVR